MPSRANASITIGLIGLLLVIATPAQDARAQSVVGAQQGAAPPPHNQHES